MQKRLENHKSAQAYVEKIKDMEYLISYTTRVLITDYTTNIMKVTGLYSNTTRRHISWYMSEYFPHIDYYTVKKAYEQNKKIDVITGELV